MNTPREARIVISGTALSEGQSLTVRVAVEDFAQFLQDKGLGDDEHGRRMTENYLARIYEIRNLIRKTAR